MSWQKDTMESVRPNKEGSQGPLAPASSHSDRSDSRTSQKYVSNGKNNEPINTEDWEKEVTFDESQNADGFILEDTDSDNSDEEQEGFQVNEDIQSNINKKAEKSSTQRIEDSDTLAETISPDNEEKEKENTKPANKRIKMLKKTIEKRTTFDGREIVFVTEFTQTDWKWRENAVKTGKRPVLSSFTAKSVKSDSASSLKSSDIKSSLSKANSISKSESRQSFSQAHTEDSRIVTDFTPFILQPDDEFGVPILDMSSDSDSSDADCPKNVTTYKHHLPSIGPPQILKYVKESDKLEKEVEKASSVTDTGYQYLGSTDYVVDEDGNAVGMFSGPCEFCGNDIKPFPTLEQQLSEPPECLYCCEEYREFVEFAMTTAARLEEDEAKRNEKISVKVHGHHGSKQARKIAKEQAVLRMRERELQRRQQEARGLQAALYQDEVDVSSQSSKGNQLGSGAFMMMMENMGSQDTEQVFHVSTDAGNSHFLSQAMRTGGGALNGHGKKFKQKRRAGKEVTSSGGGSGQEEGIGGAEKESNNTGEDTEDGFIRSRKESRLVKGGRITVRYNLLQPSGSYIGFGSERGNNSSFQSVLPSAGEINRVNHLNLTHPGVTTSTSSMGRLGETRPGPRHFTLGGLSQGATGSTHAFYGTITLNTAVARQMKTINYQLSSQRCLEAGWTLRAPSPMDMDDVDNETFVPEPLHPAMIASGMVHGRSLIEKYYPNGNKFLTMFPDGTGNVFYPSGRLAISISCIHLGQNLYIVQEDADNPTILGVFEPNGCGCCYFTNGKVRLTYNEVGGLELHHNGGRKRAWSWKDQETHVHAPPFQPIVFSLNRYLGIRFIAQESIALTLNARKRSCRLNVGIKIKLVVPDNVQPKGVDEHQLFISEHTVRAEMILNKITNLLKFPKSPKVDCILPPLAVTARQQKVEKMRQEYTSALPLLPTGRKSQTVVKKNRLSPLDPAFSLTVN